MTAPPPQRVAVNPVHPDLETDLARARTLANWLDTKFEIAGVMFGYDTLIGLLPVAGDAFTAAAGCYPVYLARKHGCGKWVMAKMLANLGIDFFGGLIPGVELVVDTAFKANVRNLRAFEKAVGREQTPLGRFRKSPKR